jgi:hypothetical protein
MFLWGGGVPDLDLDLDFDLDLGPAGEEPLL